MPVVKELLLSCVVMMLISFLASRPVELGTLQKNIKDMGPSLSNLKKAEKDYVTLMFPGEPPMEYKLKTLQPIEGITFGKTTEEIQASICAICDYLHKHLPAIIKKLTHHGNGVLHHTAVFLSQFNAAVNVSSKGQNEAGVPKQCHRNVTTSHNYTMKETGLRIIYSTRQWVETFTNTSIPSA